MAKLHELSDQELLGEISRRFDEKEASIKEMEFMTKKLLEMNEKTKAAEATKSKFLSLIKNEFNNPISTLLNISKKLVEKKNQEKFEAMSQMMHLELLRLDFHLKNIFNATEIEAGEIANDYSVINFESIYTDVMDSFRYLIEDKRLKVSLTVEQTGDFVSDAQKVYMILLNILSNACEFSYPEKEVLVRFKELKENFCIEVEDFGEGIFVEDKKEIYNRFTQFHKGETRPYSGLGLGLSVARALVEALDGDIDYESSKGHTTFTLYLPKTDQKDASTSLGSNEFMFDDFDDSVEM
jgi:signal transduction histidine kinase